MIRTGICGFACGSNAEKCRARGQGTKMLYVEGHSAFNGENEMILQRGTKFRPTKVSTGKDGRIFIDLEVRGQNPLDLATYKK